MDHERQITAMVLNLLTLDRIGREENFFLLGGHSLLGAQLIEREVLDFEKSTLFEITRRGLYENAGLILALPAWSANFDVLGGVGRRCGACGCGG